MKAIGCPPCMSTAPIRIPDALVSIVNSLEKSGSAKTGGLTIASLRTWKALAASSFHLNWFFLSNEVKGLQIVP